MNIDELLDDETPDPKKYFDEKEYSTLIVNREGFSKQQNDTADLIETLLEKDLVRTEQEDIFTRLKELNAQSILVSSIKEVKKDSQKAKLCSACWESGLDFTSHFVFFVELSCSDDFSLAMEALTVVENIEGQIPENILVKGLEIAQNTSSQNKELIDDLINNIKQRS